MYLLLKDIENKAHPIENKAHLIENKSDQIYCRLDTKD